MQAPSIDGTGGASPGPGKPSLARRFFTIDTICAALVVAITVLIFVGVVFRYVLQMPLTWGEEAVRYSFTWLAFMSAALAMKYHGHAAIDLISAAIPEKARFVQRLIIDLIVIVFLAVFAYYSARMAMIAGGQTSSALRIPMSWVYAAAPVSSVVMLCYGLRNMYFTITGRAHA